MLGEQGAVRTLDAAAAEPPDERAMIKDDWLMESNALEDGEVSCAKAKYQAWKCENFRVARLKVIKTGVGALYHGTFPRVKVDALTSRLLLTFNSWLG